MRSPLMRYVPRCWWPQLLRLGFNLYPSYRGTGAWVESVSVDLRHIRVRLRNSWRTRNPAGSIFGGALFAAVDPMFAVMLAYQLPEESIVWVKRASARFRRPARTTVWADCFLPAETVDQVAHDLVTEGRSEPEFTVVWRDQSGTVYCEIGFTIFAATSEYMRARHSRQENP